MLFILLCNECKETPTQFKLKVFYMLQLNICLGLLSCFSLVRLLLKLWLGLGTITTCLGLENIMVWVEFLFRSPRSQMEMVKLPVKSRSP